MKLLVCDKCKSTNIKTLLPKIKEIDDSIQIEIGCFNYCGIGKDKIVVIVDNIPIIEKTEEWKSDYSKMKEDMIYEEKKPSFLDLTNNLHELRTHLQAVKWNFELIFPKLIH